MGYTFTNDIAEYDVQEIQDSAFHLSDFEIPMRELLIYLNDSRWENCTPLSFLDHCHEKCCPEHEARIANADLSYPIIFDPYHELIDGVHRIIKAIRNGEKYIKGKRLPKMPTPKKTFPQQYNIIKIHASTIESLIQIFLNYGTPKSISVDLYCLGSGIKKVGRTEVVSREAAIKIKELILSHKLYCRLFEKTVYFGTNYSLLKRAPCIDNSSFPHAFRIGGLFGYPPCCCLKIANYGKKSIDDLMNTVSNDCEKLFPLISPREYIHGASLISHVPCSGDCQLSINMAEKVSIYIKSMKA